jgi:hypothetical protein
VATDAHRGVVVEAAPFAAFEIAEPDPAFTHVWGKSRAGKNVVRPLPAARIVHRYISKALREPEAGNLHIRNCEG